MSRLDCIWHTPHDSVVLNTACRDWSFSLIEIDNTPEYRGMYMIGIGMCYALWWEYDYYPTKHDHRFRRSLSVGILGVEFTLYW
jgi:hypothetical protein